MKKISIKQKVLLLVCGLSVFMVLLEVGLRATGLLYLSLQEYRNILSIKQKGEYRILCLGESTTMNQWPRLLENILNKRDPGIKFSVIDKGINGTNTRAIVRSLERHININLIW